MRTIALIIAKGESTRLPGKNMLPFCGLPLFAWSVIQSVNSHLVEKTFLSTDDNEIAKIGEKYGAEIIHRIIGSNDETGGSVFKRHTLELIEMFPTIKEVVLMLPTAPLRKPDDIDKMIRMRREIDAIRIISVWTRKETMIYKKLNAYTCKGVVINRTSGYTEEAGATNVSHVRHFKSMDKKIRFHSQIDENIENIIRGFGEDIISFYSFEPWQRFDINTEDDFAIAEMIMKHYILKGKDKEVYYDYGSI